MYSSTGKYAHSNRSQAYPDVTRINKHKKTSPKRAAVRKQLQYQQKITEVSLAAAAVHGFSQASITVLERYFLFAREYCVAMTV